jgi:NAD(P)-dependent dehydrogenase (short-subunit alcohol dehydrogenase family)
MVYAARMSETALITGAASGFGLLTAIELAQRKFRVIATMRDLRKSDKLDAAAREAGVTVEKLALDVTRPDSIARAVKDAGQIDVLVNNAGFGLGGFFEDLALDELREQFETNFFGVAAMMMAVLPQMRARGSGRILNVSSIGGRLANPGLSAYCSSKFAVEGLSESARHELRPLGIWVVLVEPGTFKTEIFAQNRRLAKRALDPSSPNYDRFQQGLAVVDRLLSRSKADPRAVAKTIARAATAKRPRMRYLVGKDARGEAFAKSFLPFGVVEKAVEVYLSRR